MNRDAFLATIARNAEDHERRVLAAIQGISDEQLNKPAGEDWSVARVFRHLCLASDPYLEALDRALRSGSNAGDHEVRTSFVGRMLMMISGPEGNAPAPKFLVPEDKTYSNEICEEWLSRHRRFRDIVSNAKGFDLRQRVRNPFFKVLPMRLADLFAVMDVHNERHIRQIEQRVQRRSDDCPA